MTIRFTILGNHEDPHGNPVPYQRALNFAWRKASARYMDWLEYVRDEYRRAMTTANFPVVIDDDVANGAKLAKITGSAHPIRLKKCFAKMNLKIYWANNAHGDPDNVFKGIADALFQNDKNLDGSFESHMADDGRGRVEAEIIISCEYHHGKRTEGTKAGTASNR